MPRPLWGRVFLAEEIANSPSLSQSHLILVVRATNTGVTKTPVFFHSWCPICQRISQILAPPTTPVSLVGPGNCNNHALGLGPSALDGLFPGEPPTYPVTRVSHVTPLLKTLQVHRRSLVMTKPTPAPSPLCLLPQSLCPGWELPLPAIWN